MYKRFKVRYINVHTACDHVVTHEQVDQTVYMYVMSLKREVNRK